MLALTTSTYQAPKLKVFQLTEKGARDPLSKTSQIAADQLQEERRETPNIAISICFFGELASYVKNKTNTALFFTLSKYLSKF